MIKRIGILTSGGDAPGMNAAIRAAVRAAESAGAEVLGIRDGYLGLYHRRVIPLKRSDTDDILTRGGTFLGTARFTAFKEEFVRKEAVDNLKKENIEALVAIGGDGTYAGAACLCAMGVPCVGVPATIDNDTHGTDVSIGFDTAVNTVMTSLDKLRDTCASHHRVSIVEVMGRNCGDLALAGGLAGGADCIITPEGDFSREDLFDRISRSFAAGRKHAVICLRENMLDAAALASDLETSTGIECRATVLGHVQRGGSPTAFDRVLASRLGDFAVRLLAEGVSGKCVGISGNVLTASDLAASPDAKHDLRIREFAGLSARLS